MYECFEVCMVKVVNIDEWNELSECLVLALGLLYSVEDTNVMLFKLLVMLICSMLMFFQFCLLLRVVACAGESCLYWCYVAVWYMHTSTNINMS